MLRDMARDYTINCISVRLRRLNRVVTNIYDDALRPLGLRSTQLHILILIARMSMVRPREVSRILFIDSSTLSRNFDRMRKRGWLEAVPDKADARKQPVRLTPAGEEVLRRAYPLWQQAQKQAEQVVGRHAISALVEAAPARLANP